MLAALDSNLIYLIAAAAYGVFAWWNDRRQKKALAEEEARQRREALSRPAEVTPSGGDAGPVNSEEERMRKFLEALGVPTEPKSPPLRPAPAPMRSEPQRPLPSKDKLAPPILAPRPVAAPMPQSRAPRSRPARPIPPPPVFVHEPEPIPMESREPGRLEVPAAVVEQTPDAFINIRDLPVISAPVSVAEAAAGFAPTTSVAATYVSSQGLALRELLRNPATLRAAVVVSEVLGPPKGA